MNRKHLSLLALILALVLTCAPLSALAESYSSTALTLKNPAVTIDGKTYSAEVALTIDGGVDMENGMGRLLFSLMGGDQTALSGGANWNGEAIIAGLDGMKKSVKLPFTTLTEQFASELGDLNDMSEMFAALEPQLNDLLGAFTALMDYVPSSEVAEQLSDLAVKALHIEHTADTSYEYDDETTLVGDCYEFETSAADLIKLIEDCRALDPELDALISDLANAFNTLLAAADDSLGIEVTTLPVSISGYMLTTENGDYVLSYDAKNTEDGSDTISYECVSFNNENDTRVNIYAAIPDEYGPTNYMIADVVIPKADGDMSVSIYMDNIEENGKSEGEGFHLLFSTNNAARSATLSLTYFEDYLYEDELYEDVGTFTLTYLAGETTTDESGVTYPGKVIFEMSENDELYASASIETELRLYTSDQAYAASDDVIDLTNPSSEDMEELDNEFSTVFENAVSILAAAPGVAELLSLFGLN